MKIEDYRELPVWVQSAIDQVGLGRGTGGISQIMRIEVDENPPAIRVALRPRVHTVPIEIVRKGG